MESNNITILKGRQIVGGIVISSKKDNFIFASVYVCKGKNELNNEINIMHKNNNYINEIEFKNEMLNLLSFELGYNRSFCLYFDYEKFKQISKNTFENINEIIFPIPYIIKINVCDIQNKEEDKYYEVNLIADKLTKFSYDFLVINLKMANDIESQEFVLINSSFSLGTFYIVHKYEEDWKLNWMDKIKNGR